MDIRAASSTGITGASTSTSTMAAVSGNDALANEQTFLKLFVTQMKNQDPLNPQDGTQFVAQLAQFSGLEQSLQMREDLDAIKQQLQSLTTPPATSPGTSATQ